MELSEARGRLIAIDGEITEGYAPLLKEFIKRARAARSRFVLLTVATDDPATAANRYRPAFRLHLGDVA